MQESTSLSSRAIHYFPDHSLPSLTLHCSPAISFQCHLLQWSNFLPITLSQQTCAKGIATLSHDEFFRSHRDKKEHFKWVVLKFCPRIQIKSKRLLALSCKVLHLFKSWLTMIISESLYYTSFLRQIAEVQPLISGKIKNSIRDDLLGNNKYLQQMKLKKGQISNKWVANSKNIVPFYYFTKESQELKSFKFKSS